MTLLRSSLLFSAAFMLSAASIFSTVLSAQQPGATRNLVMEPVKYVSPEIHSDHTVTLRLLAPTARSVSAEVEGTRIRMTKDENGIWSGTTAVLKPEIYSYRFTLDGTTPVLDPQNPGLLHSLHLSENTFTISGDAPMLWEPQSVPRGEVTQHFYTTSIVKGLPANQSYYYVYTPPGYSPKGKVYPVLYLLHGYSDDADGWLSTGKANLIFDALIHAGKMKPMVVVMTLGYGDMSVVLGQTPKSNDMNAESRDLFEKALLTEVMPQIETNYHLSKRREDHAIAGLSMGGNESLTIGLAHTDKFAWIGTFSANYNSYGTRTVIPTTLTAQQANLKLLWIACGVDDQFLSVNHAMVSSLKAQGLPVTAIETPGHHQWSVWRGNLIQFAPMLFQN